MGASSEPDSRRSAPPLRLEGQPLDALLLDLDDTILDDSASRVGSWELAVDHVRGEHPDVPRAALADQVTRAADWYWSEPERSRLGRLDLVAARTEILERALHALERPDAKAARIAAQAMTAMRERAQRFLPGAREALEALRARVPAMALVTNGAREPQRAKIVRFELEGLFDHVQLEGEFGAGKPEPEVYANVLSVLDVRADRCLMVGDNFEADVLGAQRAGIHAAWVDKDRVGTPPAAALRDHWTILHIRELLERL